MWTHEIGRMFIVFFSNSFVHLSKEKHVTKDNLVVKMRVSGDKIMHHLLTEQTLTLIPMQRHRYLFVC